VAAGALYHLWRIIGREHQQKVPEPEKDKGMLIRFGEALTSKDFEQDEEE
jgi:hypothetical protein